MRIDFFTIPVYGGEDATEEVNGLLSSGRILSVERQFVSHGEANFWSICVLSQPGASSSSSKRGKKSGVDYREVLGPEDFAVYARLRDLRKDLAGREGVPVYAVLTNEQMAEIARHRCASLAALERIEGFGEARSNKYGAAILSLLRTGTGQEGGKDDAP
jgi:superfamily II DNA helicase RecQ